MLSTCWIIGAYSYFLAVSSHKRGRLNTSVYGSCTQNLISKYTSEVQINFDIKAGIGYHAFLNFKSHRCICFIKYFCILHTIKF